MSDVNINLNKKLYDPIIVFFITNIVEVFVSQLGPVWVDEIHNAWTGDFHFNFHNQLNKIESIYHQNYILKLK